MAELWQGLVPFIHGVVPQSAAAGDHVSRPDPTPILPEYIYYPFPSSLVWCSITTGGYSFLESSHIGLIFPKKFAEQHAQPRPGPHTLSPCDLCICIQQLAACCLQQTSSAQRHTPARGSMHHRMYCTILCQLIHDSVPDLGQHSGTGVARLAELEDSLND